MTPATDWLTVEYESPRAMMLSSPVELCPSQVRSWLLSEGRHWQIAPTWNNWWNRGGEWKWTNHANPYWNEKVGLWCWLLVPAKDEQCLVGRHLPESVEA